MTIFDHTGLERCGIFYPLQTFSVLKEPVFEEIPLCIDASHQKDLNLLEQLALKITPKVLHITDDQRAVIHLAAVFVNNFTNHLFNIAQQLLQNQNISLDILLPLEMPFQNFPYYKN